MSTTSESWTGERLETFIYSRNTAEHLHRYAIAMRLAAGKKVLDIACGEGYGSKLLSSVAKEVCGVDIDNDTVQNAVAKYRQPNLSFSQGSTSAIPFPDAHFDLVISFETIEHHDEHEQMMLEIKRVLKPDGVLFISSPDKHFYSEVPGYSNPFHVKELYAKDFELLIQKHFRQSRFFSQRYFSGSIIIPVIQGASSDVLPFNGNYNGIQQTDFQPVYNVCLASDALLAEENSFSLFDGEPFQIMEEKNREDYVRGTTTDEVAAILRTRYEQSAEYRIGARITKWFPFLKRFM